MTYGTQVMIAVAIPVVLIVGVALATMVYSWFKFR